MQLRDTGIDTSNSTLNKLIGELGEECKNVTVLINQLQLENLSNEQKVDILSELLAATIHLHSHCGNDFQDAIADELDSLPECN